jgi:hypothetical protein
MEPRDEQMMGQSNPEQHRGSESEAKAHPKPWIPISRAREIISPSSTECKECKACRP